MFHGRKKTFFFKQLRTTNKEDFIIAKRDKRINYKNIKTPLLSISKKNKYNLCSFK